MTVAHDALERLLLKEEQVTDLLAFLAGLDPKPLADLLGLEVADPSVSREVVIRGGRADLLVKVGDVPVALLEIKLGAGLHGHQLDRYEAWANAQLPPVPCHLVDLAGDEWDVPDGWRTDLTLPQLFLAWKDSTHPHARWLGTMAASVLTRLVVQREGKIGLATRPVVADLVTRKVAAELLSIDRLSRATLQVAARRTSGGTAMVIAWLPYPGDEHAPSWLCVDLRAASRAEPARPWLLRLGVEAEARESAHDLVLPLRHGLTTSSFARSLRDGGRAALADAIRPSGSFDGLAGDPDDTTLAAWRTVAVEGGKTEAHPALFHDRGLRLASQSLVDVTLIDRHQLLDLLVAALDHLAGIEPA